MTSATSMTSERGKGMFLKIIFLKSVHSSKKDELCPGFEVKILTKSVHRGGVLKLGSLEKTVIASLFHSGLHSSSPFLWKKQCHMLI